MAHTYAKNDLSANKFNWESHIASGNLTAAS